MMNVVYTDVIEVMFLCQVAALASHVDQCSSYGRRRGFSDYSRNGTMTMPTPDLILLRFKAVDMFLCIDANDARVRLKRIVSDGLSFSAKSVMRFSFSREMLRAVVPWQVVCLSVCDDEVLPHERFF